MSLFESVMLPCPRCQARSPLDLYSSVNVTHDPHLRERVLDGTLSRYHCRSCGHEAPIEHDLRYHDMQLGFVIQEDTRGALDPSALGSPAPGVVSRLVRDRDSLIEKVQIFEARLDDRVIEVVKLLLRTQDPRFGEATLRFAGAGEGEITLVAFTGEERLALQTPLTALASLEAKLVSTGKLGEQPRWGRVDEAFAAAMLDQRTLPPPLALWSKHRKAGPWTSASSRR